MSSFRYIGKLILGKLAVYSALGIALSANQDKAGVNGELHVEHTACEDRMIAESVSVCPLLSARPRETIHKAVGGPLCRLATVM
jgi:hypothetical protein